MNVLASTPLFIDRGSRARIFTGRVLTGLIVVFLLIDAIGKLIPVEPVIEGTLRLGYPVDAIRPLGVVLATSTLLHAIPRTELVGAVLLTAYLGGATAAHVRTGTPLWFSIAMGVLLWIAYALRTPRLRGLVLSTSTAR